MHRRAGTQWTPDQQRTALRAAQRPGNAAFILRSGVFAASRRMDPVLPHGSRRRNSQVYAGCVHLPARASSPWGALPEAL